MKEHKYIIGGDGYDIWEVDHIRVFEPVRFVCLGFDDRPDDRTLMRLRKSQFLYAFFEGQACWHTVSTAESVAEAMSIAAGLKVDPDPGGHGEWAFEGEF